MRAGACGLTLALALGGVVLFGSREGRADFLCGGGNPPEPAPSSSVDAGADAAADGPVGFRRRPCMSGAPWSGPAPLDFGLLLGMVVLGGGAAASSRKRPPPGAGER